MAAFRAPVKLKQKCVGRGKRPAWAGERDAKECT